MMAVTRLVEVRQNILKRNDEVARALRRRFSEAGVFVVSVVSSPGAGKTAFLDQTLTLLRPPHRVAAVVAAGVAAVMGWPRAFPALAPAALLLATAAGAGWYLVERAPGILPMLGLAVLVSAIALLRGEGDSAFTASIAHRLRWYALGVALLAATWGFYFNFLTIGFAADSVARRLVQKLFLLWAHATGQRPARSLIAGHVELHFDRLFGRRLHRFNPKRNRELALAQ